MTLGQDIEKTALEWMNRLEGWGLIEVDRDKKLIRLTPIGVAVHAMLGTLTTGDEKVGKEESS